MPTTREEDVDRIIKSVLGKDLKDDDNIFDFGANSLTAIEIVSMVNAELGNNLSLQKFFSCPTKRTLREESQPMVINARE